MNEKLLELITPETVLSYADGCIDVYDAILDLQKQNYHNFVIPSRGAYPFYYYTIHAHSHFAEDFLSFHNYNTRRKVLLLPFTSDWGKAQIDITSGQSRRFWTKVLDDFLCKRETPYTKFYSLIVEKVAPRLAVNTTELLPSERFITNQTDGFTFLDTVVSGRAICEIIASFQEFDIKNYFLILILDGNGELLEPQYKKIIHNEEANGRARIIRVKKIFSEDASPILNTGITSMVFPSLMERALGSIQEFKQENLVGAGLWFSNALSHIYGSQLNGVRGTLFDSICWGIRYRLKDAHKFYEPMMQENAKVMIEAAGNFNLFDQDYTRRIVTKRIMREVSLHDQISVSSSHVLRTALDEKFLSYLQSSYRKF